MKHRSYNHSVPGLRLYLVGDRWTLLIIRELLTGPRRFFRPQRWATGYHHPFARRASQPPGAVPAHRRVAPRRPTVYELTSLGQL